MLPGLRTLRALDVSGNRIGALPLAGHAWQGMEALELADNPLLALPEEISTLAALLRLDLRSTWLESLPDALAKLQGLRTLLLAGAPVGLRDGKPPDVIFTLEALEELDEHDREIVLMRHVEHLGNSEVAQALGLSPAAAGMRYLRAIRRLRAVLSEPPSRDV